MSSKKTTPEDLSAFTKALKDSSWVPDMMYHEKLGSPIWDRAPKRYTFRLTCLTRQGIIIHTLVSTGTLPEKIAIEYERPEKQWDPRLHWDDHVAGKDLKHGLIVVQHYAGTVYIEEGAKLS